MAETDPIKYFEGEIKRLNYYNSQFLKENDFNDEQLYHRQMRHLHNRALHTWGIVSGLEVKRVEGTRKVTVTRGTAIDRLGQEIVLPQDATIPRENALPEEGEAVNFDGFAANSRVYLTIRYREVFDQADKDTKSTSKLYTRATERPLLGLSAAAPAADAPEVVLATITLDSNKDISAIGSDLRRFAGARIGSAAGGKEFGIYADSFGAWHFSDGAKGADRLTVDNNGNLKIGSGDLQLDVNREIFFRENGQIRSGDDNHRVLFRRSENKLELREFGDILFSPGATSGGETVKALLRADGNFGIGTRTPGFPLSFANVLGPKIALWGQSGNHYGFGIQSALLQIYSDSNDSDVAFGYGSSASFTERMRVRGNGNVGIGTSAPRQKLEVAGNLQLSGTRTKLFYRGDIDTHVGSLGFYSADGGKTAIITPYDGAGGNLATSTLSLGGFGNFESNAVSLLVSGGLAVGRPKASAKLDVNGDVRATSLSFADADGNAYTDNWLGMANNIDGATKWLHLGGIMDAGERRMMLAASRIYASGNLGIGTNTPGFPLSFANALGDKIALWGQSGNHYGFGIQSALLQIHTDTSAADVAFGYGPSGSFTETMRIKGSGAVGIGTSAPSAGRLNISEPKGTAHSPSTGTVIIDHEDNGGVSSVVFRSKVNRGSDYGYIQYQDASTQGGGGESARFIIGISNDADDHLVLQPSGNVGIGTDAPVGKLDVRGSVHAGNSDIYFTKTDHNHTGFGNTTGYAAIENAADYGGLMILGRMVETTTQVPITTTVSTGFGTSIKVPTGQFENRVDRRRLVKVWDYLEVNGDLKVTGSKTGYVVDEFVNRYGEALEQGDVVVIGENQTSLYYGVNNKIPIPEVDIAQAAYDTRVCGIVSHFTVDFGASAGDAGAAGAGEGGEPGANASAPTPPAPEESTNYEQTIIGPGQNGYMVTLGAFAYCKVDADIAPVEVGDLLTTSPTKGHAQKVQDRTQAAGAVIGKALGALREGKGKIPVLVTLH